MLVHIYRHLYVFERVSFEIMCREIKSVKHYSKVAIVHEIGEIEVECLALERHSG
jgi:nucleoside-triphosphatase THEP1